MRSMRLAAMLLALCGLPVCAGQREANADDVAKIPPLPPAGLTLTLSAKGEVELAWKLSKLESVVAYKVYRRYGDGEFKLLKEVKTPSFVDKSPPRGDVEYAVTSVDSRSGESKLSRPAKKPEAK